MATTDIDETFDDGLMSGTFRWSKSKRFIQLPPYPKGRVEYCRGWGPYLKSRTGDNSLIEIAKCDSSLLDCLSFPLTTIFWLIHFKFLNVNNDVKEVMSPASDKSPLTVVVFGASQKAVVCSDVLLIVAELYC
jgi:hypothetical protein